MNGNTIAATRPLGMSVPSVKPINRAPVVPNARAVSGSVNSPGVPSPLNNSRLHGTPNGASTIPFAKPTSASTTRPIVPTSTTSTSSASTGRVGSNGRLLVSSSVPASRPPLSNVYRTTPILPTSSAAAGLGLTPGVPAVPGSNSYRVNGLNGTATGSSPGHAPVLFDFRTTDRSPGMRRVNGSPNLGAGITGSYGKSPTPSSSMSLLSQRIKGDSNGHAPIGKPTTVTNGFNVSSQHGHAGGDHGTASVSTAINRRSSTTIMAASTGGGMNFNPRMRPRAMSVTMKIKGEVGPDGSDDEFEMDDTGAGGMAVDGEDGSTNLLNGVGLGQGSGGIKGKRKGMVFKCESCAKVYRHPSCLSKHRWEHSPHWASSSKLLLSKHQQVQLLEAATILVHLDPHNPASGKPLPEDKSLWPAAAQTGREVRKPSPAGSSSSTESSDRSNSADHDSGYSSGNQVIAAQGSAVGWDASIGRPLPQPVQSSPAFNGSPLLPGHRQSFSATRPSSSLRSGNLGSLPDLGFAGFHIGSPRSMSEMTVSGDQSNGMFHVGSTGTAKAHNIFSASPYSAHLRLPESSVRSNGFHGAIEEDDEDDVDDDDEMNQRHDYPDHSKKLAAVKFATILSGDRAHGKTPEDVADMEWEANDMEM
ncbi:hypothetical protein QFC21_002862 [Naganishia friedmannii]|uniref:Uncharacterized protein n=1 Tax=Naganishia friedmannii TaxID=89922 RepID=A0ACC2VU88_9TREE|nr:hypothetical protein QFC21_002862 [Naganishia friedmannii]